MNGSKFSSFNRQILALPVLVLFIGCQSEGGDNGTSDDPSQANTDPSDETHTDDPENQQSVSDSETNGGETETSDPTIGSPPENARPDTDDASTSPGGGTSMGSKPSDAGGRPVDSGSNPTDSAAGDLEATDGSTEAGETLPFEPRETSPITCDCQDGEICVGETTPGQAGVSPPSPPATPTPSIPQYSKAFCVASESVNCNHKSCVCYVEGTDLCRNLFPERGFHITSCYPLSGSGLPLSRYSCAPQVP